MSEKRIILANRSRLMREMLKRALFKVGHLKVVQEITDANDLPDALGESDAEWVILSLPVDNQMPAWVDGYLLEHPPVQFIAVSPDGSQVKIKWLESREKNFRDLTLEDLIHLLEKSDGVPGFKNEERNPKPRRLDCLKEQKNSSRRFTNGYTEYTETE